MEELIEKIDNLKKVLDKDNNVINIRNLNNKIKNNKELLSLINNYKKYPSKDLKYEIYNNSLYKEYKESETEINLLIMSINSKLKTISNRSNCK
ncbi:MAG: YlbF family regulator [Bacilli bacterium]|nr:YlbF family regulator [Bacilli bacterium]